MPASGESRYTLILDSRDAVTNVTKFKNSLNTAFANLPGIKQLQAQFDGAKQQLNQLGASVSNLEKLKAASTGTATEVTKLSNAEKTLATNVKTADTGIKNTTVSLGKATGAVADLEKKTGTFGKKMEGMFSKGGVAALGVSSLASGMLTLNSTFRDFGDVQIAIDKAQRKASLATEARNKAQGVLNELTKKGVTSGADFQQATLDVSQALEKERLAIQDVAERGEDAFDKQSQMILGLIQTSAGIGTTVGTVAGSWGKLVGVFNKVKGVVGIGSAASKGGSGLTGALFNAGAALTNIGAAAGPGGLKLASFVGLLGRASGPIAVLVATMVTLAETLPHIAGMFGGDLKTKVTEASKYFEGLTNAPFFGTILKLPGLLEKAGVGFGDMGEGAQKANHEIKEGSHEAELLAAANADLAAKTEAVTSANQGGGASHAQVNAMREAANKVTQILNGTYEENTEVTEDNTTSVIKNNGVWLDLGNAVNTKALPPLTKLIPVTKNVSTAIGEMRHNIVGSAQGIASLETALQKAASAGGHVPVSGGSTADEERARRAANIAKFGIEVLKQRKEALIEDAKAQGVDTDQLMLWSNQIQDTPSQVQATIDSIYTYADAHGVLLGESAKSAKALADQRTALVNTAKEFLNNSTITKTSTLGLTQFNTTIGKGLADLKAKRDGLMNTAAAEKIADNATRSSIPAMEKQIISMTNLNKIYDGSIESETKLSQARIAGVEAAQDLVTQSKLKAESDKTELASLQKLVAGYGLKLPGSINTSIESLQAIVKAQESTGEGALALGKILDEQLAPAFQKFSSLLHETDVKEFKKQFKDLHLEDIFGKSGAKGIQGFFNTLREGTVDVDKVSTAFEALKVATKGGLNGAEFAKDAKKLGDAIQNIGELDADGLTKPMEDFYASIKKMTPEQLLQHAGSIQKFFEATNSPTGLTKEKADDITNTFSKENTTNIGTMATNAGTLGEKLDTIAAPDITPFTSSLTDAANAAKLTATGVSTLKFVFPAPDLADYAQALKDSGTAAKLTASGIAGIKYNFPPPNISNAKNVMTDLYKWGKRIAGDIVGIRYKFPSPDIKSAKGVMNDLYSYAKRIVGDINGLKGTIHVSYSVDKKPSGLTSSAKGGVFPNTSIIAAAQGRAFTTHGPQLMVVGDNPGGRETVAAIPHDNPMPTLAKVMEEFGSKISGGISGMVGGGGGMNNGEIIINIRNVNNDRETLRTFKAQMGRDTYKFGG